MHITAKFHHPAFNRSEVIMRTNKLTNKQTPLKTSTSLRYVTPMGNNYCPIDKADADATNSTVFFVASAL